MKLLIALLLFVGTSSFIRWFPPHSWQGLRRTSFRSLAEEKGPEPDASSERKVAPFILEDYATKEIDEEMLTAIGKFVLSSGAQLGLSTDILELLEPIEEGNLVRVLLNVPKDSKVTFGKLGDFVTAVAEKAMKKVVDRLITNDDPQAATSSLKDAMENFQQNSITDPSPRLKSTTPLELFLSSSQGEDVGEFFFGLFMDQMRFDHVSALLEGHENNTISQYSPEPDEDSIGELELRIAQLVLEGFDGEKVSKTDRIIIAKYMKDRVIPSWFADHAEELRKMVLHT